MNKAERAYGKLEMTGAPELRKGTGAVKNKQVITWANFLRQRWDVQHYFLCSSHCMLHRWGFLKFKNSD